jgi:transcriptional regulator with XRE-family HTH domain
VVSVWYTNRDKWSGAQEVDMEKLREARLRQFLSIRDLAARAGVSTRTVVQIEQGRTSPTFKTARKIAAALGVAPGEIAEFAAMAEDALEGNDAA